MTNSLACKWLNTDLLWAQRVRTLAEVRTDRREGHEVTLHGHLLTALAKHLLKDTWVEAGNQNIKGFNKEGEKKRDETRKEKKKRSWPEYGHLRSLLQKFFQAVHHPGVKLDQVHHLCQVSVVLYWKRGLVHTCVGLKQNTKKTLGCNLQSFTMMPEHWAIFDMLQQTYLQSQPVQSKCSEVKLLFVFHCRVKFNLSLCKSNFLCCNRGKYWVHRSQDKLLYLSVITLFDWQSRQGWDKRTHQDWLLFWTHIHVLRRRKWFVHVCRRTV